MRADRRGATIIEFAIVAPLFLFLLFGLLETSLVYFVQESLETLDESMLRLAATGGLSDDDAGRGRLRREACRRLPPYMQCAALRFDLTSAPSMSAINPVEPGDAGDRSDRFALGGPGDVVVLRMLYQWPLRLSPLSIVGRRLPSESGYLLVATRAAKSEAYR